MFTQFELNNFLTDTVAAGYSLSAVQIFRAAVCLLHKDPEHVRHSTNLKALLKHSKHTAPPKQLLEPTVDITHRLCFLAEIPSDKSARLVDLNKKTAFLLVMAAFLRPSDLERINLQHCTVTSHGDLVIKWLLQRNCVLDVALSNPSLYVRMTISRKCDPCALSSPLSPIRRPSSVLATSF